MTQIRHYLCFVIKLNHLSCPCFWSALAMFPAISGSQNHYPMMKHNQLGWVGAFFFSVHTEFSGFARKEGRSCRWDHRYSTWCMLSPSQHHINRAVVSRPKPVAVSPVSSEVEIRTNRVSSSTDVHPSSAASHGVLVSDSSSHAG